jgi:uncharacterized membrane protein
VPPELKVFLVSIIPIVEMKGSIPLGVSQGVSVPVATVLGILGTFVQLPANVLLMELLVRFAHRHERLHRFLLWSQRRSEKHRALLNRWGLIGVALLVGIPLPGTGLWTGTVAGYLIGINRWYIVTGLVIGTISAGILVGLATAGITRLF